MKGFGLRRRKATVGVDIGSDFNKAAVIEHREHRPRLTALATAPNEPAAVRSVELSSARLDLVAGIDLVEAEDGAVTPVDCKRGKRPHVPRQACDPERVQLCA